MKKEFKLEKGINVESINIDVKANLLTVVYAAEKTVLKVGEWWYHSTGVLNLIVEINESMKKVKCIPTYGIPHNNGFSFHGISAMTHKADMKEVEKLLIDEAEKRGYKKGVKFKMCDDEVLEITGDSIEFDENWGIGGTRNCLMAKCGGSLMHIWNDKYGWAEIIREPLYTNSYGTEFFEGDRVWHINKGNLSLQFGHTNTFSDLKDNEYFYEIMTERECHRYLDENWDELN